MHADPRPCKLCMQDQRVRCVCRQMLKLPPTKLFVPHFLQKQVEGLLEAYRQFQCDMPCEVIPLQVSLPPCSPQLSITQYSLAWQSTNGHHLALHSVAEHGVAEPCIAGHSVAGHIVTGQSGAEHGVAGHSIAGHSIAGQSEAEHNVAGHSTAWLGAA